MMFRRMLAGVLLAFIPAAAARAAVSSLALDTGFDGAAPSASPLRAWVGPSLGVETATSSVSLDGRFGGLPVRAKGLYCARRGLCPEEVSP